jgi:putative membrane-bound dehydrogenase-like protein
MNRILPVTIALVAALVALAQTLVLPQDKARRIEVLFLGAPTANHPGHDPIERYRIIRKHLGVSGIDFTYTENLADLRREVLDQYDAVMMYANWEQSGPMDPDQEKALIGFVEDGGAFLPLHCASACFGASDAFIRLVGGRFKSHGDGVFRTVITAPDHPVMRGYQGFEAWDETYVHDRHGDDRTILQRREDEPWTWVRNQGKGRVFYTAYGHDMRCWGLPEFHELLRRAVLWSVGEEVRSKWMALKLPELQEEDMLLPGYRERKAITRGQKPLPPEESIKLAQVPTGFEIALFASEPDIVNPIHLAWDHRGRAFVVETVDYPNNLQAGNIGNDRIRICEDTNGDGRADKFTLFADKLSIPTSMVFANGGVICTNGSEILFLKDTDGDDRADQRKVLFEGFHMGDTHAGVSNLRYGFDHWIYATVGYSGFSGKVGGEDHKFATGLLRFKSDGSRLEFLQNTTNNTWGLGFTSHFDILGSTANGNPSWFHTFPKAVYQNAGLEAPRTPAADDNPMFFPISTDIRQVDVFDRYTSGAGHAFYTAARFPDFYQDQIAFVCGPTGKLVGQFRVTREGAGYKSRQLPNNLYSSADGWSAPVHAETGPDGAVWICDWYNIIVQHNPTPSMASAGMDAKTGRGNAYVTPLRDVQHGRIYRVYPQGSVNDPIPDLDPARPATLVAALSHPNLFWRLEAQRHLIEHNPPAAIPDLRKLVLSSADSAAASHAFRVLQSLGKLDHDLMAAALASSHRGLRRAVITEPLADGMLVAAFTRDGMLTANDPRELAELFVALTRHAPSTAIGGLLHATYATLGQEITADNTLHDAWRIAARHHAAGVVLAALATLPTGGNEAPAPPNLLPNPGFEDAQTGPWSLRSYGVQDPASVTMQVTGNGRNGGKCLMIRAGRRADVGAGVEVEVKPNTRYRLGGWIRTENLRPRGGQGALFNVHQKNVRSKDLTATTDWTEVSTEFDTGNSRRIVVHCLFGGYGGATGTAWWDDVYLVQAAGDDSTDLVESMVAHLAAKGAEPDKQILAAALAGRNDPYSRKLLTMLATAPLEVREIVRKHPPDPEIHARGLEVYNKTCIACHGPDGKGVPLAFPPLVDSKRLTGDPSVPIRIVLHGMQGPLESGGVQYNNIMAPLGDLTDQQISDVLTYVRQHWSNDAAPVSAAAVTQVRARHADRKEQWNVTELDAQL